jgi:hypothetical protein
MKPIPTTIQPGATHWNPKSSHTVADWYKYQDDGWFYFEELGSVWLPSSISWDSLNNLIPVEALMAQHNGANSLSPEVTQGKLDNNRFGVTVPEWNGEGLPPAGTVCEVSMSAGIFGASVWSTCTILAHDIGSVEIAVYRTKDGEYGGVSWNLFRPVKPEREKAIQAMNPIICSQGMFSADGDACKAISAALYDAGYRKVVK